MLRALVSAFALSVMLVPPVVAQGAPSVSALSDAMMIRDITGIMHDEGLEHGATLEDEMFPGAGGDRWTETVARIYDADRAAQEFDAALAKELEGEDAAMGEMLGFLTSDVGSSIIRLEIEARRTLMDDAAEDAANLQLEEMAAADEPRLAELRKLEETNALIEMNVAGALNTNLAFYQGMAEAGAFGDMPEDQMLSDVWAQEDAIRTEAEAWLYPYMSLAYATVSDADLEQYIAFSASDAGRRLNSAVFVAFDQVFARISRDLGKAAGLHMQGEDI